MTTLFAVRPILAALALAGLAACGGSGADTSSSTLPTPRAGSAAGPSTALRIDDPWCKAADAGMTSCFATLVNLTDIAIRITAASSPAAGMTELHETVKNADGQLQMQPAAGGFTLAPAQQFALEPGANHIMLMQLSAPLKNGDPVSITLTTSAGPLPATFVVRTFAGANESYQPSGSASMREMTHS